MVLFGDSKTDAATPNTWPTTLQSALNTATGLPWNVRNFGKSGTGLAYLVANLPSYIATVGINTPTEVLINIGVNDFGGAGACGCETDFAYVADTINAAWPTARLWFMQPWKRNFDAAAAAWKTGITNVVATRTSFAHMGPDEASWLKSSDNGDTYTTNPAPSADGIHYKVTAGENQCETVWLTALGY